MTVLNVANLALTFAKHYASPHIDFDSKIRSVIQSHLEATYDLERWTCDMTKAPNGGHFFTNQCHIESAARYVLLVQFIMALAILAVAFWAFPAAKAKYQKLVVARRERNQKFVGDVDWEMTSDP